MPKVYTIKEKLENIDNADKECIVFVDKINSLILQNIYFSDIVRFALQFERTYDEPIMTQIFDESKLRSGELKEILKSIYSTKTPIFIFWHLDIAIKTTWGMLIKYWDTFFYSASDEAIIYISQDQVYIYTDMILRKINNVEKILDESIFDCFKRLENQKTKSKYALDCLVDSVSKNLQDELYCLFYNISLGVKTINDNELRKEYIDCIYNFVLSFVQKIILICKPYNEEGLQSYMKNFNVYYDKSSIEKFNEFLKKIMTKKV